MGYGNGTNAPSGLQLRSNLSATTPSGQEGDYLIASGYATSLFNGDRVARLSDGTIGIAGAGQQALGVFQFVRYTDTFGNPQVSTYWPASTATLGSIPAQAFVVDDYNMLFDIQVSNSANVADPSITTAMLGQNANLAIGGGGGNISPANPTSGNTRTGLSGYYLDFSTIAPDSTLDVKIVRFTPYVGNVSGVAYNNVLVTLNNDTYRGNGVGFTNDQGNFSAVKTGAYTALMSDFIIRVNPTGAGFTVTLPTASATTKDKQFIIKNVSASTNTITIAPATGTINGAASVTNTTAYGTTRVVNDGSAWWTI